MNDIDPQAWLADVLNWLPDHPANKLVGAELESNSSRCTKTILRLLKRYDPQ
jgi:hypothetical protein